MPFISVQRRKQIVKFYREKGIKRTQRKFKVSWGQVEQYLKMEETMEKNLADAKDADKVESKKLKKTCSANTRKAKKQKRLDKTGTQFLSLSR